jgi:FlaA1/EpsC-like NDP-sugar epimerase
MNQAPPAEVLLGRPEFAGDLRAAAAWCSGKRVLVTGAAGSIGSRLAALLNAAQLETLVLVDHHEYSLFMLERGLAPGRAQCELVDIRDARRLRRVFEQHQPDVVFHLAAAKHVPYGERFPEGAVATNVLATQELLRIARHVVYPSSDKSVQPPSLYGATKRICEGLAQMHAHASIVRYVNVIGTRGSVIEVFSNQVQADRPLSVTDERMTRYWISMDEAVWSLLQTGQHAQPGEVLMPECGEPVPLLETARRLAEWYAPQRQPYPIACTGIRPGERLHEVLLSDNESLSEGPARGLRRVQTRRSRERLNGLDAQVGNLHALVQNGDRDGLKRRCLDMAEALQ